MGTFCESNKRKEKFIENANIDDKIDAVEFYDVIVNIQSIKNIVKGWNIKFSQRIKNYEEFINIKENEKVLKIGIIGNSNKGKSFILSKLSHIELPFGTNIKTEGLSIKYPDLTDFPNRKIVLLDSAGLETPVLSSINENLEHNLRVNNNQQNKNTNNSENNENNYFKEKAKEKIITERFLQNYIIYNSDILIVVVGILTYSEQKTLNKIKTKFMREKNLIKPNINLFIIHNLMTYTTIEQVENYIKDTLLQSATFKLEKQTKINTQYGIPTGVCYYEINSNPKIFHLIYANENSEAGKYYNQYTLSFIEKLYEANIDLKGFDIVKSIKERIIEESKDIIEIPKEGKIEFVDKPDNLIKLKTPKILTLKNFVLDELGIQNIMPDGFEPNYSYRKTNDAIIIKIEVPGKFRLNSSIQYNGEYVFIHLNGCKYKEDDEDIKSNLYNERKYGNFSLNIPIKQENFVIVDEVPTYQNISGIIKLTYKIKNVGGVVPIGY